MYFRLFHVDTELEFLVAEAVGVSDLTFVKCVIHKMMSLFCIPDQWSPLNPEGKKRYERDFLMELQNDPQSKKKPENLPDIEVVLKDNTNRVSFR